MLTEIAQVLTESQVENCLFELARVEWSDGRGSAGYLSQAVKRNQQLPDAHPVGRKLGQTILAQLDRNARFIAAALPQKILPPLFNRYESGSEYGPHIDGAIRPVHGTPHRIRTDLSATLFLSGPEDYDGGELLIEDAFGPRRIKLAAGDMVLYPGTSVHRVLPITRGTRYAAFFWIQSMVRGEAQRRILLDLDNAIQSLAGERSDRAELVQLAGVYHNLLRLWADT